MEQLPDRVWQLRQLYGQRNIPERNVKRLIQLPRRRVQTFLESPKACCSKSPRKGLDLVPMLCREVNEKFAIADLVKHSEHGNSKFSAGLQPQVTKNQFVGTVAAVRPTSRPPYADRLDISAHEQDAVLKPLERHSLGDVRL